MKSRIKGIDVILRQRRDAGPDEIGNPIWGFEIITVGNVLVEPSSDADRTESMNLFGKAAGYTLHIPKGDAHDWENAEVEFFGRTFRTVGIGRRYIKENVPLEWDMKIGCELIDVQD
ncbi:MAG: hypothetical protein LBS85_00065 [Clostridiales Family XIII bacterium]|jgi:hypothetical protein|nr:hypothetical protein [Clostridiales Family XIII bacterium]